MKTFCRQLRPQIFASCATQEVTGGLVFAKQGSKTRKKTQNAGKGEMNAWER